MNDKSRSEEELTEELAALRQRVADLEASEPKYRQAQERVAHLNAVLRAIRSVNQLVAREKDRDRLLQSVCDCLIETRGYRNTWIALLDEDGGMVTTAEAGLGDRFRPMVERLKHGEPTACARKAFAQPGPVVIAEPALTCADCPLASQYSGRGAMTIHLEHAGKTYGLLSVSTPAHLAIDEEERALFEEVAGDIAFALHGIELEETRRRADETIRALLNARIEVAMLIDPEGTILAANEATAHALEHSTGDLLGACVYDFLPPGVAQSRKARVAEALASRKPVRFEDESAGGIFAHHIYPVFDQDGNVISVAVYARDFTEERQAQQRAYHQERLAAVGQLAGGIAHDFNNLLTTIMLHAQLLLRERDLPEPVVSGLGTIIGEARQASQLVGQVLDFSRRAPLETQPLDLKPFIEEVVRMLQHTIPESISLQLEAGEEAYTVHADPTRIKQVVMNLAINARDAMPKGGELHIKLSKVQVEPGEALPLADMVPGGWVCLAVSDTGTGIAPEALSHIFEPFFTTKQRGQGTGLGLAQAYGIVMRHGGHIGVDTETGRGTTFRVYLPAHRESTEEMPFETAPSAAPRGQGEVVLLVEDSERIREVGRGLLESLGYRVLTAANGREALDVYRSVGAVDLVVTDIVMPEMGGRELVQELRLTNPGLNAVVITGYALEEDLGESKDEGILAIIRKPFDIEGLADCIRQALDTT